MNQYNTPLPEPLFALMYSSDAAVKVEQSTLDKILETSRRNNKSIGVTGILLFRQGRFYQYLEGSERAVRGLYETIRADTRHTGLKVLLETGVAERRFADWIMGYEPLRETAGNVPHGFRSTFDDIEDTENTANVLRAVTELTHWYRARSARVQLDVSTQR